MVGMKRTGLIVLLVLLTLGPARADALGRYQLIMWQERTAAQIIGLARLGFTGMKITASGGRIDPGYLAIVRKAKLPWYFENIATDVLSPYHRWTPGKPVTWRFDAAKAQLRADPTDTSVFARQPSLSDPLVLADMQARLAALVTHKALFYNLADEAGIGDLAAAWDADISPASLTAMRVWLRGIYPNLAALNHQWDTHFPDWDAIMPMLTDAALHRNDGNFSAWMDFKAWMDVAFSRALRVGTDALHRADPDALSAIEGAQLPGWGGYDYSLLAPAVDVMEVGDIANAAELARAFHPGLILLRTSFGIGPREAHAAWHHLLLGGRGTIVWDEHDDVVHADGTAHARGRELAALTRSIRAVAPALSGVTPAHDPVAVLVSQSSFRMRWLLDRRAEAGPWWARDAAREYEDNAWTASRRQILRRLHAVAIEPKLLSSAMLEDGALRHDGIKVLILAHAIALSDAEVAAITTFIQTGGRVLTDSEPGLFDGHGRRRATTPLAVTVAEPLLLNGAPDTPEVLTGLLTLLAEAGVHPRATLLGPDGATATGIDTRWLRVGGDFVLALQSQTPWGAPGRVDLRLATPALVADLRADRPGQHQQRLTLTLDPVAPTILRIGSR